MTVGIVLEPTNNVSLAVDYFNIKLEEVISQGIPAATILSDLGRYGSLVTRGAPQVVGGVTIPGPIIDINQTNINLGTCVPGRASMSTFALPHRSTRMASSGSR